MASTKKVGVARRKHSTASPERNRVLHSTETATRKEVSSSNNVLNHLRELIEAGELRPGERLPAERDLAAKLKVSRPTLRAGLRSLVAMGVLESWHGSGTYVVDISGPPALDANPLRMMAALRGFSPAEMLEARLGLEMLATGLAAERADPDALALLAEEMAGIFASVDEPKAFLIHDVAFHRAIASASGNRIIAALIAMIVAAMYETRKMTVDNALDLKESAKAHRIIYRAIRDRNPQAAREAMRKHLQQAFQSQQQEMPQNS